MTAREQLAHKLNVQAAQMQRGIGGKPQYSATDLAAMLAGLDRGAQYLAYAKECKDPKAARQLYSVLHLIASDWARVEGWDIKRGSAWVYLLAMMVRDDLILSRPMMGRKQAAEWMSAEHPITEWQWRSLWKERHSRLLAVGLEWEFQIDRKLNRELYETLW